MTMRGVNNVLLAVKTVTILIWQFELPIETSFTYVHLFKSQRLTKEFFS